MDGVVIVGSEESRRTERLSTTAGTSESLLADRLGDALSLQQR